MAVAAASALPALLQAEIPTAVDGSDARNPMRRYKKYELIGQGAQKKVYRAFDEERGIEVAWNEVAVAELARFREKDQQRVFAEIRVLKQLKHKNIMSLHDYWFDECRLMLVFITEIFPDGTLRQYRRRHKHADVPAIKRWAWQILQGLVYLHGHNPPIIHRDLKCDNIFVCGSSGIIKIGDLGLVTLCRDFSAPQSVLGTPEFMAPELYEEKYDEKVDVYAFGMCLLELATMEYPYCECKNAAQIYKKVTQGIPPASVEKLTNSELRDFVMLCLCHDPSRRPEARQLLKHSFFEAIRAAPSHIGAGCGTPPKLTMVSSVSVSPSVPVSRPVALAGSSSASTGSVGDGPSPTVISRTSFSSPEQCSSGGGSSSAVCSVTGVPASPLLSVRSTSVELPQPQSLLHVQLPMGLIAASLSPQATSPIAAAVNALYGNGPGTATAAATAIAMPAPTVIASSIAAAGSTARYPPSLPGAVQLGVSPLGAGDLGSVVSSLSPAARPGMLSSALATAACNGVVSPPNSAVSDGSPALSNQSANGTAGKRGLTSSASAATAALPSPQLPRCGVETVSHGRSAPAARSASPELRATVSGEVHRQGGLGESSGAAFVARMAEGRSLQPGGPYAGLSPSAAAIAAAAVSAAAAAVGASSGPSLTSPLGLPAIDEDHELNEDMMFDQDDCGRRGVLHGAGSGDSDDDSGNSEGGDDGCGSSGNSNAAPATAVLGGCRSQPVSLKVRSSGHASVNDMALSFAMSFTNQRGVRKKVGFQYDLLHDTASAIAVEMVENLSLNTAEAEAIAAMIQHEVSRFNQQQQQQQQEE